ncbi:hypothetical protein D3C81_1030420 [compost metagenome]
MLMNRYNGILYTVVLQKLSLYLTKLNAEPANFNLMIKSSQVRNGAVRQPFAQVPGPIHHFSWCKWI